MNGQFEAAWQLHRFLTDRDIPYIVIEGIAGQRWGEPHLTIDVDLSPSPLSIASYRSTCRERARPI